MMTTKPAAARSRRDYVTAGLASMMGTTIDVMTLMRFVPPKMTAAVITASTMPDAMAAFRMASPLRPDPDFRTDLLRLVDALRAHAQGRPD